MQPGTRIGRFEIQSLLGRGGMGEVYRARDTRLGRDVALKLLAPHISSNREAVGRFEQEARAASALNHPAIVTIFDVGEQDDTSFIVTELLEGQTLRDRLESGRIDAEEALDVAALAASGLAAAHAAGIIHRDVKPENIFLVRGGAVKILDFGIARLVPRAFSPSAEAEVPTAVLPTLAGTLIGTPGYMAPEQARGAVVDTRADIFALGCVIYEMLTGARAFSKPTPFDTLAAVVGEQPPPLQATPTLPRPVVRVIERALQKDPAARFQSMEDFAFALTNARGVTAVGERPVGARSRLWYWLAPVVIVAAGVAAASLVPGAPPTSQPFELRATTIVPSSARPISPALSPDGKWVAYIGLAAATPDVFVQFLNGADPVNLTRPHNVPVQLRTIVGRLDIAPDSSGIFVPGPARAGGLYQLTGIWSVPAPLGGPPHRVTDKYGGIAVSSDGTRIAAILADPLEGDAVAVAAADGSAERLVVPPSGGLHFHQVAWSPDDRYIYYVRTPMPNHTQGDIYRVPVQGGTPEVMVRTHGTAMYPAPTPDGAALIYAGNHHGEGFNLWWHPLDGSPERRLTIGTGEYTEPFVSRNGTALVCLARRRRDGLIRVSADGTDASGEMVGGANAGDTQPSIPSDGLRVFVSSSRGGERGIWSIDMARGTAAPLTAGESGDGHPAVSPDGRQVAFLSSRGGRRGLWLVSSEGSTPRLVTHADIIDAFSWSPDSRRIVYAVSAADRTGLWIADTDSGQTERIPNPAGRVPGWSPRGNMLAVIRVTNRTPTVHFISPQGAELRTPIPISPVGHPMALAWSPDATRLALVNLPAHGFAQAWVLDIASGQLRRVLSLPAPNELGGVAWTPDGRSLILGRTEFDTEVLLIEGLPHK